MSIRRVGDSFYITIYDGSDSKGDPIRHYTTYKPELNYQNGRPKSEAAIKKDVEAYANEFEAKVKSGSYSNKKELQFSDFVENIWKSGYGETHLSQRVLEDYLGKMKRIFYNDIGKKKLSRISAADIQKIINDEYKKGKTVESVKRDFSALRSVLKYAFKLSYIDTNPCERVELPRCVKHKEVTCYTPEQAIRFIKALDTEFTDTYKEHYVVRNGQKVKIEGYTETHVVSPMWKLYFLVAITTGIRRGEMCALTWNDIDMENRTIRVNKAASMTKNGVIIKEPKTAESNRIITYPKTCDDYFREWYNEEMDLFETLKTEWKGNSVDFDENNLFIQKDGRMVFLTSPSSKFKETIERYNKTVPEEEHIPVINLHALRHTCASVLINQGVDIVMVSRRLGHSKISTTLDIYTHSMERNDKLASDAMDSIFGATD